MTLGLHHWLALMSGFLPRGSGGAQVPRLDLARLADHDIADLNLPPELIAARQAREQRRYP